MFTKLKNKAASVKEDAGFTLLELMIVVVVIAVLAAIAILISSKQTHAAIEASVKSDVVSNQPVMIDTKNKKGLYLSVEDFMDRATSTDDNTLQYTVSEDKSHACLSAERQLASDDIIVVHFDTETGVLTEGFCESLDGGEGTITPPGGGGGSTPPPGPGGGGGGGPTTPPYGITSDGKTVFTTSVSNNSKFYACVDLFINTTSVEPIPWEVTISKSVPPWRDNHIDNGGQGDFNIVDDGNTIVLTGNSSVETASITKQITPTLCVPGNPIDLTSHLVTATPLAAPTGSAWYASQSFVASGSESEFYGNWKADVDLAELIALGNKVNKQPILNDIKSGSTLTHIGGTMYRIHSIDASRSIKAGGEQKFVIALQS